MGRDYELSFAPTGSILMDGHQLWGETDHSAQTIRVEEGLPHDKERAIVLHETLHQILALADAGFPDKIEEKVCTLLGEALIGHMRDNPGYWRYLLQKPPKPSPGTT